MTLALPYRAQVAKSHALWVIGVLGQSVFGGLMTVEKFTEHAKSLRAAYDNAETNEKAYEDLMFLTARLEQIIAEATANARTG